MRIIIDTNVLISAILFPDSMPSKVIEKVSMNHKLVLCSYIIEELHEIFERKFKDKKSLLEKFLVKLSYEYVYSPTDINKNEYPEVRDKGDLPILVTAILEDVDMIVTGDKDFSNLDIDKPEIITPREFADKY